jgi:hypothetical protein
MSELTSMIDEYIVMLSSSKSKERMARKKDINARVQEILSTSDNYSVLISLIYNPNLNANVQMDFARRFQGLVAHDFINHRRPVSYRLKAKNLLMLMDRLAMHPNLDPEVQRKMANTAIRLDKEAYRYISNNRFDIFKREVLLYLLRSDVHTIASSLLANPAFTDQKLRRRLANHFDIPLSEDPIWSVTKGEHLYDPDTGIRMPGELVTDYSSIWSRVKA